MRGTLVLALLGGKCFAYYSKWISKARDGACGLLVSQRISDNGMGADPAYQEVRHPFADQTEGPAPAEAVGNAYRRTARCLSYLMESF